MAFSIPLTAKKTLRFAFCASNSQYGLIHPQISLITQKKH
jgi:hypothetical protein